MIERQSKTKRASRLVASYGGLEGFARAGPAGDDMRAIRDAGRREVYSKCCIEFFALDAFGKLRGKDLNLRPLGYENNRIIARSFASIVSLFLVHAYFPGKECLPKTNAIYGRCLRPGKTQIPK